MGGEIHKTTHKPIETVSDKNNGDGHTEIGTVLETVKNLTSNTITYIENKNKAQEEEYVDIIDENGKETGESETKKNVHENGGKWHKAALVWILKEGKLLFQERSKETNFSGLLDVSAAGHIKSGETEIIGAIREIGEELGLRVDMKNLILLKVEKIVKSYPEINYYEKEFVYIYLLHDDNLNMDDIKFNDGEVTSVQLIDINKFKNDLNGDEKKRYFDNDQIYISSLEQINKYLLLKKSKGTQEY
ncbi:MAG: NUDIX domain-containing protein [Candidatus Gracilibacteria bacterium]|nr:NUDIX domain-containing protein [Candidatus Gracilibacteria bacterium]